MTFRPRHQSKGQEEGGMERDNYTMTVGGKEEMKGGSGEGRKEGRKKGRKRGTDGGREGRGGRTDEGMNKKRTENKGLHINEQ